MNAITLYEPTVSGLWGHSHDAESDLMKRFMVEKKTPSGWLAMASFNEVTDAELAALDMIHGPMSADRVRVFDQFTTPNGPKPTMSEWAESRRHLMSRATIEANERLYVNR
jgi:hypothetical protein